MTFCPHTTNTQAEECPEQPDKSQEQLVECEFCELAMQLSKLQTHEYHCGARTERCPNCGQFVMLSVLAQHKGTCRSTPALSPRKGRLFGLGGREASLVGWEWRDGRRGSAGILQMS